MNPSISELVRAAHEKGASDLHLVFGLPVRARIDGSLVDLSGGSKPLTDGECEQYARSLAGEESLPLMGELDLACTVSGFRCRVNLFRQQGHVSCALRLLADRIPDFTSLGLPTVMGGFSEFPHGIVLITGETGSGKSTTLASLLDRINHTRPAHIITLEDPIEYLYTPDRCTINQREIGSDTVSYESGLKSILREDPDVILIGEMRSLDTIEAALTAAETGHLVFSTLHTNSAPDAVDRIVAVFPAEKQQQIRLQLSMTLRAVVAQQLLVRRGGRGRCAACEIMILNDAIRNLIRDGKSPQISNALATSAAEGNMTMDSALLRLVHSGVITAATAISAARDAQALRRQLDGAGAQNRTVIR